MLNMPLESLKTDFSNKTYVIWKKIHTFFFLLRSSILKLNYLSNYGSSIYEIWFCNIPLNFHFNSTTLSWFGYFKANLHRISHNDLSMDLFSRVHLYNVPRLIVSSLGSEIATQETIVHVIVATFYNIPIWCLEQELWIFSHDHLFLMKVGSLKNP